MDKLRNVKASTFLLSVVLTCGVRNHPVIKEDGLLSVFLSEPSFEEWRKHTPVSLDEESASKRIDHIEEMTIPSDLEDKLGYAYYTMSLLSH